MTKQNHENLYQKKKEKDLICKHLGVYLLLLYGWIWGTLPNCLSATFGYLTRAAIKRASQINFVHILNLNATTKQWIIYAEDVPA